MIFCLVTNMHVYITVIKNYPKNNNTNRTVDLNLLIYFSNETKFYFFN